MPVTRAQSKSELEEEVQQLQKLLRLTMEEKTEITIQRDAAETHCTLMQRQNALLQQQVNSKESTSTRQIHTTSQILTSDALVSEWMEDKARREARAQKEADEKARKAETERLQLSNHALGTKVFSSSLTSKNKADLKDIAAALALPEDGKKDVLVKRIRDHLNAHAKLANNPRFASLYASLAQGRKRAAESEDGLELVSNSSQRRRISLSNDLCAVHSPSPHRHGLTFQFSS